LVGGLVQILMVDGSVDESKVKGTIGVDSCAGGQHRERLFVATAQLCGWSRKARDSSR
jgi:hypothetical protein